MEYKWLAIHTHSHTNHSDGQQTLLASAMAYKHGGIDAFFLTDHNTVSGYKEIPEVEEETEVNILKGIEYTTYYGHILAYGDGYVDWTSYGKEDLRPLLHKIKENHVLVGLPHRSSMGYPFCTGCRFEYNADVEDYRLFDFMEIFNAAEYRQWEDDYTFWLELLGTGMSMTATVGLDSHLPGAIIDNPYVNMVKTAYPYGKAEIIDAIRHGRVVVSKYCSIDLRINHVYELGDSVRLEKEFDLQVSIRFHRLSSEIFFSRKQYTMNLITDTGTLIRHNFDNRAFNPQTESHDFKFHICKAHTSKYIRAELIAQDFRGNDLVAISNCIYLIDEVSNGGEL